MKDLSNNLIAEKNQLSSPNPWLLLLDIIIEGTEINIVRNTENITFKDKVYIAFPFDFDFPEETARGELTSAELKISNVTRVFQTYLEEYDGAVGATVKLIIVNTAWLGEDYTELEVTFNVMKTISNAQWVTFTLGMPSPRRRRIPFYKYIAEHCNWVYKSAECAYTGTKPKCLRTLDACRYHDNTLRYGGFPGLTRGGIRIVSF